MGASPKLPGNCNFSNAQVVSEMCPMSLIGSLFWKNGCYYDRIINWIADLFYHTVSGCMTAQVAHEYNYQQVAGSKQGKNPRIFLR